MIEYSRFSTIRTAVVKIRTLSAEVFSQLTVKHASGQTALSCVQRFVAVKAVESTLVPAIRCKISRFCHIFKRNGQTSLRVDGSHSYQYLTLFENVGQ